MLHMKVCFFFFFFLGGIPAHLKGDPRIKSKESAHLGTHECRASQITSCTEGIAPSEQLGARSRRDMAKAFAAVQPNNFFYLLSHDLRPSR